MLYIMVPFKLIYLEKYSNEIINNLIIQKNIFFLFSLIIIHLSFIYKILINKYIVNTNYFFFCNKGNDLLLYLIYKKKKLIYILYIGE